MDTADSLKADAARYRRLLSMGMTDAASIKALGDLAVQCDEKAAALLTPTVEEPSSG